MTKLSSAPSSPNYPPIFEPNTYTNFLLSWFIVVTIEWKFPQLIYKGSSSKLLLYVKYSLSWLSGMPNWPELFYPDTQTSRFLFSTSLTNNNVWFNPAWQSKISLFLRYLNKIGFKKYPVLIGNNY